MQRTETKVLYWKFSAEQLGDTELVDKLLLSLCGALRIDYPHFKLQLLISELVSNAIDHGVLSLKSHLKNTSDGYENYLVERAKRINELSTGSVYLSTEWTGKNLLRITVKDSGTGFNYTAFSENSDPSERDDAAKLYGRGLSIINNLCKSVTHQGNGNCTIVEFDVATAEIGKVAPA